MIEKVICEMDPQATWGKALLVNEKTFPWWSDYLKELLWFPSDMHWSDMKDITLLPLDLAWISQSLVTHNLGHLVFHHIIYLENNSD